jgi:hypothetical protein
VNTARVHQVGNLKQNGVPERIFTWEGNEKTYKNFPTADERSVTDFLMFKIEERSFNG